MGFGDAFRDLGDFLDDCERRGTTVERVGISDCGRLAAGEELTVEVELTLVAAGDDEDEDCDPSMACTPRVGSDGTLSLAVESEAGLVPTPDHEVSVDPSGATINADGTVTVTLSATVATAPDRDGTGPDAEEDPDRTDGRAESTSDGTDVPPFKNPDLLADVYESCDTFAEMADSLAMDVTAETVRRYMIDYDIHQPNSYRTESENADSDAEARAEPEPEAEPEQKPGFEDAGSGHPVVLSDGIGLPDDVTVDHLIDTVEQSNTIYEVKQDIGIDRQDALDMLQELNLLDLVVGRLATEAERDISREDVVKRLREASATGTATGSGPARG